MVHRSTFLETEVFAILLLGVYLGAGALVTVGIIKALRRARRRRVR